MKPYEAVKAGVLTTLVTLAGLLLIRICGALDRITANAERVTEIADRAETDAKRQIERAVRNADNRLGFAIAVLDETRANANARTSEAINLARMTTGVADRRLEAIQHELSSQLGTANHTLALTADQLAGPRGSVTLALNRYRLLPDEISRDPIFKAYEAQGLGTIAATKILMGDSAKAARTFDAKFPALLDNANAATQNFAGVSADVHTFTSRAVAPRGFWGNVKDIIGTSSGAMRAAGAAGLF